MILKSNTPLTMRLKENDGLIKSNLIPLTVTHTHTNTHTYKQTQ